MEEQPQEPRPQKKIEKAFSSNALQTVIEGKIWQDLKPNYATKEALHPRNLNVDKINALVQFMISTPEVVDVLRQSHTMLPPFTRNLPNLGTLRRLNPGEGKVCCEVTTDEGEKIAILLGGYRGDIQVPSDPRLYMFNPGFGKNFYYYSDLRTYLCLPLIENSDQTLGVFFQEWGGDKHVKNPNDPRLRLAASRVQKYIQQKGMRLPKMGEDELKHPRHYLLNRGAFYLPAVIDIPVEEIK